MQFSHEVQVQSEVVLFQRSTTCSVLVSAYYLCHRINDECLANCLIAPFVDIVLWF